MKSYLSVSAPKFTRVLLILFVFIAPLGKLDAQRLTLSSPATTLGQIIKSVTSQSDYQFFYEDKLADIQVNDIRMEDATLEEVLATLLKGKGLSYKIEDKIVYLAVDQQSRESVEPVKEREITGTVVDQLGEPLIGVNVSVKETSIGTITDFDGRYSLKVTGSGVELLFSYIGYKQQVIKVGDANLLNVIMQEDAQLIDEVVVTALGIKREKKMLGYAIQDVKSEDLNATGDAQVMSALQGKVAGLQINTSGTGLGGSAKITIRGNSSLTASNQPLWIVDGVPFTEESTSNASMYEGIDRGSTAFDINPEDIESISVLKGPNAAALYGSRAGNGVILITTKKGTQKDGFGVNYTGTMTWTQIADQLETQTKYGQGSGGVYSPKGMFSFGPELDGSMQEAWNGETIPYQRYGNKMKDYFNTGFTHNHSVSIGNVKEDSHFRTSFGYSDAKGLFEGETMKKLNVDLNGGMKYNKYLSMDAKISLSNTKAENRPVFGIWGELSQLMIVPNNVRLSDLKSYTTENKFHDNWTGPRVDYFNPYYVNKQYQNSDERWRAFGYYNLKVNFTDWLYLSAKYAFDYYRTRIFEANLSNAIDKTSIKEITQDNMTRGEVNHFESNAEFLLIGNNEIGSKIKVGYTLGANFMYGKSENFYGHVENMIYKNNWMFNHAHALTNATDNGYRRATNSVFGSLQLAYNDYLSLDITGRNDISSTLPKDNNSYYYGSYSLGFVVSDFIKTSGWDLPRWITFAKLRLSAAEVGKDTDPYQIYERIVGGYIMGGSYNPSIPKEKKNMELKPERTWSYEAGLDMKFFDNRLGFDLTAYYSRTRDQIMRIESGAPWNGGRWINSGIIDNKGVEAMIYATPIKTRDFAFNLTVNMAHNVSTVKELHDTKKFIYFDGDSSMPIEVGAREGHKLGEIYAKNLLKRDENGQMIIKGGLPQYENKADNILNNPIGCIQPDLTMSVTPSFSYKGITLSALFDMKFGGDIVSVSEAVATSHGIAKRTEERGEIILPGVGEDGTPNTTPTSAELYYGVIGGRGQATAELFVYDASFIRIKELSVGYSFPKQLLKKTPFTALRVSAVGRNLFYLMKHTPGTSPEGGYNTNMFSQAIDFSSLPYSRTFGVNINIAF